MCEIHPSPCKQNEGLSFGILKTSFIILKRNFSLLKSNFSFFQRKISIFSKKIFTLPIYDNFFIKTTTHQNGCLKRIFLLSNLQKIVDKSSFKRKNRVSRGKNRVSVFFNIFEFPFKTHKKQACGTYTQPGK